MFRSSASNPTIPSSVLPKEAAAILRKGWHANLDLGFTRYGERTVLARRRHTGPLVLQKALYPEGPGICHGVILHPPGGLAAGDDLALNIEVDAGAHALLTTPGATKWYKGSADQPSKQRISIVLQENARVDWLPQDNIYFDHSHAHQHFELRLAPGATAIGWDSTLLGRQARGESWQHAQLRMLSRISHSCGAPLWEERQVMRSGDPILTAPQGLAGWPAYGTLWAVGPACTPELAHELADALPFTDELRAGATALPSGLLLVRAVAAHSEPLRTLFAELWLRLRPIVHGVPAQPLRLWST